MANPAHKLDPPPPEDVADALEAAGLPRNSTMMDIIVAFHRMKDAATKPDRVTGLERDVEPAFPLKALLPLNVSYRVGLEAAERGVLRAFKDGGRWLCTKQEMQRWLAATGRGQL